MCVAIKAETVGQDNNTQRCVTDAQFILQASLRCSWGTWLASSLQLQAGCGDVAPNTQDEKHVDKE